MNKLVRELLPFGSLILVIAFLSLWQPDSFITVDNFLNVLRRSSVYGIIALGMTLVIISGGIDLSVGSLLALCGMFAAGVMTWSGGQDPGVWAMVLGTMAGLLTGVMGGTVSGVLITRLKLQPFIATLGTMSLYRGIALVMYDGQPINVASYRYLGEGSLMGIPVSVVLFALVTVMTGAILHFTRFGRHVYAIGSNFQAAYHAGVKVDRTLVGVYLLGGLFTGLGAMIAMSRTVSAQPTAGVGAELDVIAAVVIGGASLSGGRGTVTGTIVGSLLISFLRNGCTLMGISTNAQLIVIGVVIVFAVALDQFTRRKANDAA